MKLLQLSIAFAIMFFGIQRIHAQKLDEYKVYLKNGNIVNGYILSYDSTLKMQNNYGDILHYRQTDIDSFWICDSGKIRLSKSANRTINGYNLTEIGLLAGSEKKQSYLSINMINGFQFSKWFSAGAGIGVEFIEYTSIPLFIDLRANYPGRTISPFIYLQGGKSFLTERVENFLNAKPGSGSMVATGFGLEWKLDNDNSVLISLGYRNQKISFKYDEWSNQGLSPVDRTEKYNRFMIKLGFRFR